MYYFYSIHSGLPPLYQNTLQEPGVQDIANINKIKCETCGYLVDEVYSRLSETLINNQDSYSQIENDEISGAEYPNNNDSEDIETNKTSTIPTFMPQILPDNEIAEGINSLNLKQRDVFNVVRKWAKEYVNAMDIMLNQFTYFFRVGEALANLIW